VQEHLGEECEIGLWARNDDDPSCPNDVFWINSILTQKHGQLEQHRSPIYSVGSFKFTLPPLPGAIRERNNGLNFELTEGVILRLAWPGPAGHPSGKPF
jgi:hypothetical protein